MARPVPAVTCSAWWCSTRLTSAAPRLSAAPPGGSGVKPLAGSCKASSSRRKPCSRSSKWSNGQEALAHGEVEAANRAFAKTVAIFDASPRFQPTRTLAAALLTRTELALSRPAPALALAEEAVSRARSLWLAAKASGLAHSAWLGQALLAQAVVRKAAGQADAARQSAEEALPHLQATMGDLAPETREAVAFLAAR